MNCLEIDSYTCTIYHVQLAEWVRTNVTFFRKNFRKPFTLAIKLIHFDTDRQTLESSQIGAYLERTV